MQQSSLSFNLRLPGRPGDQEVIQYVSQLRNWLAAFANIPIRESSKEVENGLGKVVDLIFLDLLRTEERISESALRELFKVHVPFTNLVTLSSRGSTDTYLPHFVRNGVLSPIGYFFLNVRSKFVTDVDSFFVRSSLAASEWYGHYLYGVRSFVNPVVIENMTRHLRYWHPDMQLLPSVSNGYMRSTYIDPTVDRLWKTRFNRLCRASLRVKVINNPNPRKIAVVTQRWAKVNPTYKNRFELFQDLSKTYDLTLVHVGKPREDLETSIFREVKGVGFDPTGRLNLTSMLKNDFACVFYPDIGMNAESRFMSNLRLAPVQMTTNSHPVSTFGSEIDYFVSGEEAECTDQTFAQSHYSEKLLLMSGIGTRAVVPNRESPAQAIQGRIVIACPWGCLKTNHSLIQRLKDIKNQAQRPIRFRFLLTVGQDSVNALLMQRDIRQVLGIDDFDFYHDLEYKKYLALLAASDFALDAFPFGGNTSVIDCLAHGVPIICQNGWQFYNMAGPALLRKVGLADCVTDTPRDYKERALEFIDHPTRLAHVRAKMKDITAVMIAAGFSKSDELTRIMKHVLSR